MDKKTSTAIGAVVIVLIIIVGAFFLLSSGSSPATSASTTTISSGSGPTTTVASSNPSTYSRPVVLTDPPVAPSGTSAIVVTYSSVMVQDSSAPGSGWVAAQGSGTVNLMSTVNSSQVIGYVNTTANSQITAASFDVVSAYAIVNGTQYAVQVPNSTIVAQVSGQTSVNSNSSIIIDMTPTLSAVYSQNSTALVLTPSSTAIVTTDANVAANAQVGSSVSLSTSVWASLQASAPSIQITSASVAATANNSTTIWVNVTDNSNVPVTLTTVGVYGPQKVISRVNLNVNASGKTGGIVGVLGNLNANVNVSASQSAAIAVGANLASFQASAFVVGANGALTVPSGSTDFASTSGVTVSPGQTATLMFTGQLNYNSGLYTTTPTSGSQYNIVVTGKSGATASTTVNAQ